MIHANLLFAGMMPLWLNLLGRLFIDTDRITIPTTEIFKQLLLLVIPCLLGFLLSLYKRNLSEQFVKASKPIGLLFLCYQFILSIVINHYIIFVVIRSPIIILAALLLPVCAFVLGYIISILLKQSRKRAITISIETGVQNVAIPVVMLMHSFPMPLGDLAAALPVCSAYVMSFPLFIAWFATMIYRRFHPAPSGEQLAESDQEAEISPKPVDGSGNTMPSILVTPSEDVDNTSDIMDEFRNTGDSDAMIQDNIEQKSMPGKYTSV